MSVGALAATIAKMVSFRSTFAGIDDLEGLPMTSATAAPAARMPAAFLGHGTPMNAIDRNRYTDAWRAFGATVPRPRAILMISAHWEEAPLALGAVETVPLVYDFWGFPEHYYRVRYDAPGAPELATKVRKLLGAAGQQIVDADDVVAAIEERV